jgi:methylitaconate Delta-isomerase
MSTSKIPCVIIRGGTSKGIFFHDSDLPCDPELRDHVILAAFGSPDPRQIDGLGGSDPLTSKVGIIRRSDRPNTDIEYTFGQVSIDQPSINYSLNCGNLAAGAAIFAVDEGLVSVSEPRTTVRIYNTNTGTRLAATVPIANGCSTPHGSCAIDGVPGTGAPIELTFVDVSGQITGHLLPTGAAIDQIALAGGRCLNVSIVDTGNIYAFVAAAELGLRGDECPADLERDRDLITTAQGILRTCSARVNDALGIANQITLHKLAIVSPNSSGAADFTARIISSNGKPHRAYAVTGAISAASAAFIDGSIVNRALTHVPDRAVTIAHPQGTLEIGIECRYVDGQRLPVSATIRRTARRIMEGYVSIDRALLRPVEATRDEGVPAFAATVEAP